MTLKPSLMPHSYRLLYALVASLLLLFMTSCISAKKLDAHIADQYNNKLPKQEKPRNPDISITSAVPFEENTISISEKKSKLLPLIVYWKYDYRHTCKLNPVIGINGLVKSVNSQLQRGLSQKITGKKLELTVEEIPGMFSIVDKGHILLLVHWHKLYVEPGDKNLVVLYKLTDTSGETKTGSVTVQNKEQNQGIRFMQSWKSSSSEYLSRLTQDINSMGKELVEKILAEL